MSTVPAAEVIAWTGITKATLRKWVQRKKVRRYGHDAYDTDDVAREVKRIHAKTPS